MTESNTSVVQARDVMQTNIVFIDGMATARQAAAKMRAEKVSYLLVRQRHKNDAWGIVVVQDFIKGVIIPGRFPEQVNVYEIMTKPVITVPAGMDIRYVASMMHKAGIRRAPVVDAGKLVGMISLSSLILDHEFF